MKMKKKKPVVNYAWIGRSRGKLWWRTVAVLTCKSLVPLVHTSSKTKKLKENACESVLIILWSDNGKGNWAWAVFTVSKGREGGECTLLKNIFPIKTPVPTHLGKTSKKKTGRCSLFRLKHE